MNPWKKSIEDRVTRFKQFYQRKNRRPLLGFFHGSEYPVHRYETGRTIPVGRALTPEDFPVKSYLEDYGRLFDAHEACGGDFIWSASIFWGIPWVEASLGCPILLSSYEWDRSTPKNPRASGARMISPSSRWITPGS